MAVPAIVTTILTSIGSMLGQVLVQAFSAIAGFFKFVNETRRQQREKEKQQKIENAEKEVEDAVDNKGLSELIDATKKFGDERQKKV